MLGKDIVYLSRMVQGRPRATTRKKAKVGRKALGGEEMLNVDPWSTLSLPPVRQIGIVTRDLPKTVEHYWRVYGIGPWFRSRFTGEQHYLKGERQIYFDLDIALAFAGNIQYEVIETGRGDRSIYVDHLNKHGEGVHHLGFFVNDFDERLASCADCGINILQSGVLKSGGGLGGSTTKYAYLDTRQTGGVTFELIETTTLGMKINASRAWFEFGALMGDLEKMDLGKAVRKGKKIQTFEDFSRFCFRRWSGLS
jgi:methylmalonyl-CoA/ethylmalonyl-CoA epimerase